ncbi:MAG: hypothetical protein EA417_15430 [Gammaproteobacteria bacterium]|nr:MAG: hypothetical protein EA417_15430 [Gammaproteobacteria bacterium]
MSDQHRETSVRLQRANVVVSNIDRSLRFYCDVLGFQEAFRHGHNPQSYSLTVFDIPPDARIGFCVLGTIQQPRILALTEISGVELPSVPAPRRGAIVLEVRDPDAVISGARALGLTVHDEAELVTNDGRRGREVGIVDFDGNLVVIYQITAHPE